MVENDSLVVDPKKSLASRERLDKIRTFIDDLDYPHEVKFEKLKVVFDLIDEDLISEYDQGLKWLEKSNLGEHCLKGLYNRRSEMEILSSILKVAREGSNKTRILYQSNLNYHQLKTYLGFLMQKGFLQEVKKTRRRSLFITTSKGNLFLYHWLKILYLFDETSPEGQALI
jgi:predicted transcriptional regulator